MSPVRPGRGASDILFIEDIRFYGHHGVTPAQQEVGAWFSVDVELVLDLTPSALSDDLGAGVDYGTVVQRVVGLGTGERLRLIERLAGVLCEALLREYPARDVTVTVRKVTAPLDGVAAVPGVRMTRSR
ncbi:MAG TPA: dihydroneopterin aldolase [Methylomirabilota bacterium]|jgi:dihydroneopterin aldolase|nr:dihydroneopterin aldolase [Methylomirabilota bacterium]